MLSDLVWLRLYTCRDKIWPDMGARADRASLITHCELVYISIILIIGGIRNVKPRSNARACSPSCPRRISRFRSSMQGCARVKTAFAASVCYFLSPSSHSSFQIDNRLQAPTLQVSVIKPIILTRSLNATPSTRYS